MLWWLQYHHHATHYYDAGFTEAGGTATIRHAAPKTILVGIPTSGDQKDPAGGGR